MILSDILAKIKGCKVLVIGDVMLDHYVVGDATRISPEAPVPVVAVEKENYTLGAAANVALNVLSLGGIAELCGIIGKDRAGEKMMSILSDSDIKFSSRFEKKNADTIIKTRVVVRGQQLCRVDKEAKKSIYSLRSDEDLAYIESRIAQSDAIILSDYNKGVLDNSNVKLFIDWAKKYDTFVAIDPKPANKLKYSAVDLMTPNKSEAYKLAGYEFEPDGDPLESICQNLDEQFRPKYLIITLGPDGMLLSTRGKIDEIMPTYAREVFDVSGAGDTAISALSLALASGISVKDAMHFANYAAGVVVGKSGTAVAFPDEILNFGDKH